MDLVERATQIAATAHKEQVRKSDGTPYIAHPLSVARILDKAGFPDVVIAAAITHDVLEDTDVTESNLRKELGDEAVDIVVAVSEDTSLEWEDRKQKYIESVISGSEVVKAVSIADKIHNIKSLIAGYEAQGPAVWKHFNRGKEKKIWFEQLLLDSLKKEWDHPLITEYERLLETVKQFKN